MRIGDNVSSMLKRLFKTEQMLQLVLDILGAIVSITIIILFDGLK